METRSNAKKAAMLGMPFGTANARLVRLILFDLVCKAGLDQCVRCKKKIEKACDLSIEHLKPWQEFSAELFWDLTNIGFSHRKCNFGAAWKGRLAPTSRRRLARAGFAWCSGHRRFLPLERFHANRSNLNGKHDYCKDCRKVVEK